jgi:3-dehydroquinate synthase
MKTVRVALKQCPYSIVIGHRILGDFGKKLRRLNPGRDALLVTSAKIWRLHGAALEKGLKQNGFSVKVFAVADGERSKSARSAVALLERIARYDVMRRPFIVAFGGGVIGDLAGFVAAVYKRGIPYVQIPTTFLAQIDAAIGGKTAIDLTAGKNLAGAFYQPKMVFSDVSVLKTLPLRQMRNGLAEAVKYGIILDPRLFRFLELHVRDVLAGEESALTRVVVRSSRLKAGVVEADEKEITGHRAILNFGHTLGHAIEAAGKFKLYQHGEAVALGMRMAADISVRKSMLGAGDARRINLLLDAAGLPRLCRKISAGQILTLMKHDKKFISGRNRFVLARAIGRVSLVEGIGETVIRQAVAGRLCAR